MTKEECLQIIKERGYKTKINFFGDRPAVPGDVLIREDAGKYVVVARDERCLEVEFSKKEFDNLSDALENFLSRLS